MEVYCKECKFYEEASWADEDNWGCQSKCNHPQNLTEKRTWFSKTWVNKLKPNKMNKDNQCRWHDYSGMIYSHGSQQYLEHKLDVVRSLLKETCETEENVRKMAAKIIGEDLAEGDSFGVTPLEEVMKYVIEKLQEKRYKIITPKENIKSPKYDKVSESPLP